MDVFISYRRDGGFAFARLIYEWLHRENISVFLDLEELRSGPFNEKLYSAIEDATNFVLILPSHALDRCVNENDWLRLEIEHAIKNKKNIIPIMVDGFDFPKELPLTMQMLPFFNGVQISREYFDASMVKLISMLQGIQKGENDEDLLSRHDDVRYYIDEDLKEKHRLQSEDLLLDKYEAPVIRDLLDGKKDVVCLDVNVLNHESAFQRFENPQVSKVIALTYSNEVAERGNAERKDNNIQFFTTQFEADDFEDKLEEYLDAVDAEGIDFVCLSMAIMDFKKPFRILQAIRNCLNDDAVMIIRDVDDGAVFAYPDNDGLFRKMQSYYIHNKYSGFRYTGRQIYSYVRKMEPKTIRLEKYGIATADMSRKDKKLLFEAWFSFIPNDFGRMLRENPDSKISQEVVDFCANHYDELNEQFFSSETIFSAGYVIYSVRF